MRLLIIDDDIELCQLVADYLKPMGFEVEREHNGERGADLATSEQWAAIILDVMMPGCDGFEVLRRIRVKSKVPVMMLTGRGEEVDRIVGLELGADDYLPKPFNPKELLARIKAVLRRQTRELPGAPSQQMEVVEFGSWTLDLSTRTLKRDGNIVTLTTGEFSVLKALVQHPREPLTRDKLMNLARGREWGAMERSIDVQVSRLRRLIEDNPSQARYIQTVWGVGYVFVPDGADS
jgi:two-component system phosphate regulon response regulator OmpR